MTPEGKVKTAVRRILADLGAWYFMPVSNGMGRHGIPDFICCIEGQFVALECKAGKGKLTALQEREIDLIRVKRGVALVVNEEEIDNGYLRATLESIAEEKRKQNE